VAEYGFSCPPAGNASIVDVSHKTGFQEATIGYRIELDKENFKFSSAHFTIFSATVAERLHGHNYYASCEMEIETIDPSLGMAFDFNLVKPMILEIVAHLDEYVLVPTRSPHLRIETANGSIHLGFAKKQYLFPADDVRLLPLVNVTAEELSRYIAEELVARLRAEKGAAGAVREVSIGVQESRGQSVVYSIRL
jgi:6-pyruvoyltetrahydropterin/6-carboxytetrahydropterin synthase